MRKAINENPLVQVAVLGAMAVIVAVVFLMQIGGSEEAVPPATSSAAPGASATAAPGTTPTPGIDAPAPSSSPATVPGASSLEAGKGLPAEFARSIEAKRTSAIFVVRDKPVSDKVVSSYAGRLRSAKKTEVYVVHPRDLADWVRVIGPVGVDRTPALVVVAPAENGGEPAASVSYGFRNYESVRQAVTDAGYDGPRSGYDPD